MTLYSLMLFLHIASVLCLFGANALEVVALLRLRSVRTTAQVSEWMAVMRGVEIVPPLSAVLVLASGCYMAFTVWGWSQGWIDLALFLVLLLGLLSALVHEPRVKAIRQALESAPTGPLSASLSERIASPVLWAYALIPALLTLGVVALMVLKLDWTGSIIVAVLVAGVSLLLGLLLRRTPTAQVSLPVQK
jgi:hypothetical protein